MLYSSDWVDDENLNAAVGRFIATLRQCTALGIGVATASRQGVELVLPYTAKLVGNIDDGVIHGGAIITLLDTASGASVMCCLPELELCPTLDLRVDYLCSAQPDEIIYARATCFRVSKHIVFTRCEAFQRNPDTVVANCLATFMRIGRSAAPQWYFDIIEGRASS